MTDIQDLYHQYKKALAHRAQWESVWQECYEFAFPQRESTFKTTTNKVNLLFDGTAPDAVDQLAAQILSDMTPPWLRWFQLTAGTDLSEDERVEAGPILERISTTLHNHFDRSNFGLEVHQCYLDLITTGTACLLFEEAPFGSASAFRFTAIPLSEICLAEGHSGRLDKTFRHSLMTLDALKGRFPEIDFPQKFVDEHDKDKKPISVIEAVIPLLKGGYRYTVFIEPDSQYDSLNGFNCVLKEAIFDTSPFISFRWLKAPGEVYGRSPVMKALPDIKTANKVVELILKNASIAVTGIWLAEDDGVLNPANIQLTPGAIIPKAVGSKGLTALEAPGKFDVSQLMIEDLRSRIRHALLGDTLGQTDTPAMTATEVLERSDEMMRILGATYGRLQSELLVPLIDRATSILRKRGEIPDVFIDGRLMKITYQSPRSDKQGQIDANNAMVWLNTITRLGDEGLKQVDVAAFVKWFGERLNIPLAVLRQVTQGDETLNPAPKVPLLSGGIA